MSRRRYAQAANSKPSAKRLSDSRIHIAPNGRADGIHAVSAAPAWRKPYRELIAIFQRNFKWIVAFVGFAAAVAIAYLMVREPAFTSAAIFQRVFMAETTGSDGRASLDAAALVKSQMYRLQSAEFSRRAIDRMIADRPSGQRLAVLYPSIFSDLKNDANPTDHERDIANRKLLARLNVWNETRTYVILVAYTGITPTEAANVVNIILAENERSNKIQEAAAQQSAANVAVQKLSMTLGPKHPQMIRANSDLAAARVRFEAERNAPLMQVGELADSGDVIPARPITIESWIGRTTVLVFAVLWGLLVALMAIVFFEYRSIERIIARHVTPRRHVNDQPLHI